jgi:predicted dehydrogenase
VSICGCTEHELGGIYAPSLEDGHLRFAEAAGHSPEGFDTLERLYRRAGATNKGLVVDTTPVEESFDALDRAHRHDVPHLVEHPSTATAEERKAERIAAASAGVSWMSDILAHNNPAVRAAKEEVDDVHSLKAFCESSVGVEKYLGVMSSGRTHGCDVLDRMQHLSYVNELADSHEVETAEARSVMPAGDGAMSVNGGPTEEEEMLATARTQARLEGNAEIELYSSWTGTSQEAERVAERVNSEIGRNPIRRSVASSGDHTYRSVDARFFVVEGDTELFGDLVSGRLYELGSGTEIDTPSRQALRTTLRQSMDAVEEQGMENPSAGFDDILMEILEQSRESADAGQAVERGREQIEGLIL